MMKVHKIIIVTVLCLFVVSVHAHAGEFDGTKPLLCATIKVIECSKSEGCMELTPEDVALPPFFVIDFDKKEIQSTKESAIQKKSKIKHLDHVDGKLIIQGAEDGVEGVRDGVGYTLAISEDSGKFVLAASGDAVAFIIFGACTLR
jgi:hypothetical protein